MKINTNYITILKYLTVFILICLTAYRFKPRIPKEIFINVTFNMGVIYLALFLINVIIAIGVIIIYLKIKTKTNSFIDNLVYIFVNWIDDSFSKVMDKIANSGYTIAKLIEEVTYYYIKIPLHVLLIIEYLPRLLLLFAIAIDVFYFQRFHYSYYVLYLLLITLLSKAILYLSIGIDERITEEVRNSVEVINIEKALLNENNPNVPFDDYSNYALTSYNTQFKNLDDAFHHLYASQYELKKLALIKDNITKPLAFHCFIRLFYCFIWGYIVYYFPLPIVSTIIAFFYTNFLIYINVSITMLTAGCVYLYYKAKE